MLRRKLCHRMIDLVDQREHRLLQRALIQRSPRLKPLAVIMLGQTRAKTFRASGLKCVTAISPATIFRRARWISLARGYAQIGATNF